MSKHFTVQYADGSKGNLNTAQKEKMLSSGEIQGTADDRTFRFMGKATVLHSLKDLRGFFDRLIPVYVFNGFYPGSFVLEFQGKRVRELLESPEAMALALPARIAALDNA